MTIVPTDTTRSHTNPKRERGVGTNSHSSLTLRVDVTSHLIDNLNPRNAPRVETRTFRQ